MSEEFQVQTTAFKEEEQIVSLVVAKANGISVASFEDVEIASLYRKDIKNELKKIEEKRQAVTKPINDGLRAYNAMAKEVSAPLNEADRIVSGKILAFTSEQERLQRIEREKAEEARRVEQARLDDIAKTEQARLDAIAEQEGREAEKVEAPVVVAPKVEEIKKTYGQVTIAKIWTFEVEDAEKIPREFLVVDSAKVNSAIRSGVREIPGIKIFQKDSLR